MEQFPKVRILRNEMREGLIRTRLNGAKVAVGDVIIFLDSHCEANVNWLPPLLGELLSDENINFRISPASLNSHRGAIGNWFPQLLG